MQTFFAGTPKKMSEEICLPRFWSSGSASDGYTLSFTATPVNNKKYEERKHCRAYGLETYIL